MPAQAQAAGSVMDVFRQQAAYIADETYATAAVTGLGAGKTRAGAIKLLKYLIDHPGALAMVTAPTFPMLRDATLRTIFETWPKAARKGGDGWWAGEMRMEMANGSEVLFRSTDDPDHLRGPNLAYVWMDEAAQSSHDAFQVLQGRLRQPGYPHQITLTTTPNPKDPFNWVYEEFVQKEQPDFRLHNWSLRDNPYIDQKFILSLERSYDEQRRLLEIEGHFVSLGGRSQFDRDWLAALLGRVRKPEYEQAEADVRVRLWEPHDESHAYVLGIDPKGQGKDLGYGMLLDFTAGVLMGEVRSENPDGAVLRAACVRVAQQYNALCVPEINGVGQEFARRLLDAGCRVWKRPKRRGETPEHHARNVFHGWVTTAGAENDTSALRLSWGQKVLRLHRLSTPNRDFINACGRWDPEEERHMPDILSAAFIAGAAAEMSWGEMGSSVAEAERMQESPVLLFRAGGMPRPFPRRMAYG